MAEHELEKLLGGFAADTLTPEERQKLFTAALQDQQLFNALADEQALKELLTDPIVRRRLLDVLQQTSPSRAGGSLSWLDWFRRPTGLDVGRRPGGRRLRRRPRHQDLPGEPQASGAIDRDRRGKARLSGSGATGIAARHVPIRTAAKGQGKCGTDQGAKRFSSIRRVNGAANGSTVTPKNSGLPRVPATGCSEPNKTNSANKPTHRYS